MWDYVTYETHKHTGPTLGGLAYITHQDRLARLDPQSLKHMIREVARGLHG